MGSPIKTPIYRGPKKNHSEVWLGERTFLGQKSERLRIRTSRGQWSWYDSIFSSEILDDIMTGMEPCWESSSRSHKENLKHMANFDQQFGRESIFLGYVRDTE